jgi:RHS repeat-associated protein
VRNWKIAGQEQVLTYPFPAVKLLNGTTPTAATYLHRDGLSSVRAITNAAGAKIEAALYKPFGEQSEWVLPGNAAPETKGWIGERYDADAGLQYLNARYYDPELSLFLQPDWFEVTKKGVGTNRFSYSFNDPVNLSDPNGNCPMCAIPAWEVAKWAVVGIIGAVVTHEAIETIDGSIVSTPVEDFDFGQEGFSTDPSAATGTILSDPIQTGPGTNLEGMTAHDSSQPTIHSTPINDIELGANIVEASGLRQALGLGTGDRSLAHHNIPSQWKGEPAVQAAIRGGYEFEGAMNGTKVVGQAGGHPAYNQRIREELDRVWELGQAEGWTNEQYRDKLKEISDRERDRIEEDDDYVKNE